MTAKTSVLRDPASWKNRPIDDVSSGDKERLTPSGKNSVRAAGHVDGIVQADASRRLRSRSTEAERDRRASLPPSAKPCLG